MALLESKLLPERAVFEQVVLAGDGFTRVVKRGQVFRIVDMEGNQAADTLFYDAHAPENRYSAVDTVREQGNIYLTTGTRLMECFAMRLATSLRSASTSTVMTFLVITSRTWRAWEWTKLEAVV